MKNIKPITREEYMRNSSELFHSYYSQFVTNATKQFILRSLKVEDIKKAIEGGDKHLNEIKIPFNNMSHGGSWWWDNSPVNRNLLKELGESYTPSTKTCVGKAAARILVESM